MIGMLVCFVICWLVGCVILLITARHLPPLHKTFVHKRKRRPVDGDWPWPPAQTSTSPSPSPPSPPETVIGLFAVECKVSLLESRVYCLETELQKLKDRLID